MIQLMRYGETPNSELFRRGGAAAEVGAAVAAIIENVRANGDRALLDYAARFDHAQLTTLEVSAAELDEAIRAIEPDFLRVLERAAENIRAFHEQQKRSGFVLDGADGTVVGQRVLPIERVGLCVPGGETPLASTVLMDAIPAKLAGVPELVLVTPAKPDGSIDAAILAAARVAGVDRVFKLGGAQAVAALAYGTESVPKVDKIVGPGGAYVAEAKRQVFGTVAIDLIAGPSEVLIVADGKSDARHVAADMLAQAEHDVLAAAVLVTDSQALAEAVRDELERQLPLLAREEIARRSIEDNGKIIVADDLFAAIDVANEIAPEHLELCVDEPFAWLGRVKHAGSVFLGRSCPEALGDYMAGPNHTLPTMGAARFSSPLGVDDFVKKTQFIYYTRDALRSLAWDIDAFARKEGLTAHARSATIRFEEEEA
ncbi:MAG: histidinol dehydrogenase [Oscillospiraceae bacterium]|nr:histidinol dehydrogenase [Oscillospiraceae bacterium]